MKRMGENIDSSNFILYENNFKVPFIIKEGLIKSYPIGPVMSFISNAFNFKYLGEIMKYTAMSKSQLTAEYEKVKKKYDGYYYYA